MTHNRNSLNKKVWFYLIIFSIFILTFLWLFQVIFLNSYYEYVKQNDVDKIASKIEKNYGSDDFLNLMDTITFDKGVCIELTSSTGTIYASGNASHGCLGFSNNNIKSQFIWSGEEKGSYKIVGDRFHNKSLVYAIRLDTDIYAFINVSLEPLGWATAILAQQLIYVTIVVLLLSFIIAYFISKRLSSPIVKMNEEASKLAQGSFDVHFDAHTGIAEIDGLASTLNHAKEELSKTEELRRDLMANVSHDLKTPLTMMKGYAEMVRDISYKDKKKRNLHLNTIIEETERLNELVNDILTLSKEEAHIEELKIESFSVHTILLTVLQSFSYLIEQEGYQFIYSNTEDIRVLGDVKRIEQVLYNLVSNATEHVGEDKTIVIDLLKEEKNIRIRIEDHGPGIDQKDLPYIWDRYYKISKNHKRESHSSGIGLSIVKHILEHHHSEYGVISKKGKGTTFYFTITRDI